MTGGAPGAQPGASAPVPCPTCDGGGVVYYEPPGWWHGSGVFTEEHRCADCEGTGEALPEPPDEDEPALPDEDGGVTTDADKQAALQALIDAQVATPETFGILV